jgi:hypothetical protein
MSSKLLAKNFRITLKPIESRTKDILSLYLEESNKKKPTKAKFVFRIR